MDTPAPVHLVFHGMQRMVSWNAEDGFRECTRTRVFQGLHLEADEGREDDEESGRQALSICVLNGMKEEGKIYGARRVVVKDVLWPPPANCLDREVLRVCEKNGLAAFGKARLYSSQHDVRGDARLCTLAICDAWF
eukprot:1891692-Rhodomonas_salina.1